MTNYHTGHEAEKVAARYLESQGFTLIELNWKTRYCEIDVVATTRNTIYFIEVKYRRSDIWGSGLDYITKAKLKQMNFAAEFWVSQHNWRGGYELAAIELTGQPPEVSRFLGEL